MYVGGDPTSFLGRGAMSPDRLMKLTGAGAALLVAVGLLVASCGGSGNATAHPVCTTVTRNAAAPAAAGGSGAWADSNADLANNRDAAGSTISAANVSKLAEAWTFKLRGKAAVGVSAYGSLTANPIVQRGVVYLQDLDSNVYVLALATGKLRWEYRCNQPEKSGPGPNGVAVAGGKVYGFTPKQSTPRNQATSA
jgi:glucose dehydrogenase